MSVSTGSYMKSFHEASRALSEPSISSDFTLEINGFEHTYLLIKDAFWPELSVGDPVESPSVLGTMMLHPGQVKFNFSKAITLKETVAGTISKMMLDIICQGGIFDATVYHGTPLNFIEARKIKECFLVIEMPETSFDNRTQPLVFTGQINGHYYDEKIAGNVPHLRGGVGQGGSC